jgi:hypothetical protein
MMYVLRLSKLGCDKISAEKWCSECSHSKFQYFDMTCGPRTPSICLGSKLEIKQNNFNFRLKIIY